MSCPRNKHIFRCDQNGPPVRQCRRSVLALVFSEEGKARTLRLHIATLRAAASWLFFRVARSSRIDLDMIVARALKNSQLTCGERYAYFGDRTRMIMREYGRNLTQLQPVLLFKNTNLGFRHGYP